MGSHAVDVADQRPEEAVSVNVSAVIVTRGDVDLAPVLDSLPRDWQKVIWNNIERDDLSVYGRYAAIEECEHDAIFVQDDDCVLPPETIQELLRVAFTPRMIIRGPGDDREIPDAVGPAIVANMPQRFRDTGFYNDHCLLGFGAMFHRDIPAMAFGKLANAFGIDDVLAAVDQDPDFFRRTVDIVVTALTPRILVDLPYEDLPWASAPNRMWKTDGHVAERTRMLELVRQVRDAE
jgi:hypothetical protein